MIMSYEDIAGAISAKIPGTFDQHAEKTFIEKFRRRKAQDLFFCSLPHLSFLPFILDLDPANFGLIRQLDQTPSVRR